jgi:hypothetical protein
MGSQDRQFLKVLSQGLHILHGPAAMRTGPKPHLDLFINVIRYRPAGSARRNGALGGRFCSSNSATRRCKRPTSWRISSKASCIRITNSMSAEGCSFCSSSNISRFSGRLRFTPTLMPYRQKSTDFS